MRIVAQAAQAYVKDNRGVILSQATTTTPVMVTTAMLSTAGYLPPGFSGNNSFGQNVCALVLEPSVGALSTMIVGEGGEALDDVTLAHFSSTMGAGGGGRFRSNGTVLQGAGGGWSMPLGTFHNRVNTLNRRCDGVTAGNVRIDLGTPVYASWMDATGTADPGFLSRDIVPGNPLANTMQTNINMGTMHIEAAGNLYLKPWAGGGQVVVGGGGGNGNLTATGRVTANGSQALTGRSDNWSVIARDSAGGLNNAAKNSAGSIHANDVYVRSAGKWVSDIATGGGVTGFQVLANHPWSRDPQSHCRFMTRSAMVSIQGAGLVRATINGTEVVRSAGLADGGGGGYSETSAVTIGVPRNATVCGYSRWVFSGAFRGWYDNFKMVAYYLE